MLWASFYFACLNKHFHTLPSSILMCFRLGEYLATSRGISLGRALLRHYLLLRFCACGLTFIDELPCLPDVAAARVRRPRGHLSWRFIYSSLDFRLLLQGVRSYTTRWLYHAFRLNSCFRDYFRGHYFRGHFSSSYKIFRFCFIDAPPPAWGYFPHWRFVGQC